MVSNFSPLASRLDEIDAKGLVHLSTEARRDAAIGALSWALPALAVLPLAGVVAGWFTPVRTPAVAIGALVLGVLAFAIVYFKRRSRVQQASGVGLALHDARLGLKDRLRTADEFLRNGTTEGFGGAAIVEAEGAIAQAQQALLSQRREQRLSMRWALAWLMAAMALVAATGLQQTFFSPAAQNPVGRAIRHAVAHVPGLARIVPEQPSGRVDALPGSGAVDDGSSARQGASQSANTATSKSPAAGTGKGGRPLGAGDAAERSAARGGAAGEGSASAARAPRGGSESAADGRNPSGSAQDDHAAQDHSEAGASSGKPAPSDGAATRQASASGMAQAPSTAPGQGGQGSMPQGQAQQPRSGNGQGRQKQNRSQQGNQGQDQGSGQQQGNGNNGSRQGQDALKSGHGALSLMLAVPMQDRLGGISNPGPVSSVTRQTSPRTGQAGQVAAGDRGQLRGDAGRLDHRIMTPQERRLVEQYFRPGS